MTLLPVNAARLAILLPLVSLPALAQGPLNPPGAPGPVMKTLQQIEPRTDVQTLPGNANSTHRITTPGSYYLSSNLGFATSSGIEIAAPNVTLDLSGFTVSSSGSGTGVDVTSSSHNVTIRNGSFNLLKNGVSPASGVRALHLVDLRASSCGNFGLQVGAGGLIERCEAQSCDIGLLADGPGAIVRNSRSIACTTLGILASSASQVVDCTVTSTAGNGIELQAGAVAAGNHVSFNSGIGIRLVTGRCRVEGNTVQSNGIGISCPAAFVSSVIQDNVVFASTGSAVNGGTADYDLDFTKQAVKSIDVQLLPGSGSVAHVIARPGRYHLAGPLVSSLASGIEITAANVHLDLCGHTVSGTGAGAAIVISGAAAGVVVENGNLAGFTNSLYLIGTSGGRYARLACLAPTGIGIRLVDGATPCDGNQFEDLRIDGSGNNAVQLRAITGQGIDTNRFTGLSILRPTGRGIMINPLSGTCSSNRFERVTIASPVSHGIQTLESAGGTAASNVFEDISIQSSGSAALRINSDNNRFTRCSVESPVGNGFWLESLASGNLIEHSSVRASTSHSYLDQGAGETRYLHCASHQSGGSGFLVYGSGIAVDSTTVIHDCLVHGSAGTGIQFGFEESSFSGASIERCNISDTGLAGILLSDAGDGNSRNNRVIDCMVTSATGTGISLASSNIVAERNQVDETQTSGGSGSDFILADGNLYFARNHAFTFSSLITPFSLAASPGSYGPIIIAPASGTGALLDTGTESHPAANFDH